MATSFTPEGLITAFHIEQGVDISSLYDRSDVAIADYESSLKRDASLLRESKGTPKGVNIYDYLFNIDTEELTLVVEDRATGLWFAKNASGAKTHVSTSVASRSQEPGRRMWGTEFRRQPGKA